MAGTDQLGSIKSSVSSIPDPRRLSVTASVICLLVLAASYTTNSMDRMLFPMLLSWISKSYHFALGEAGLLATVFTLGMGLAAWPAGYLLDRHSRKSILIWGMIVYSLATLLTIWARGFFDMLVYRAVSGVGEAMQLAAVFAVAGSYFYKNRAMVLGAVNLGFGLGGFLGPNLGTRLMLWKNNWHVPFVVYAALGFVMAGVILVAIPKVFTESKGPRKSTIVDEELLSNMPKQYWNRNLILVGVSELVRGSCTYGFISLYSTFLIRQLHFAPMAAGAAFGSYGLGAMMGIPGGWLGDRLSNRRVAIAGWCCAAGTWYLMYNVAVTPHAQSILAFLIGLCTTGLLGTNCIAVSQRSVRPEFVGRATGYDYSSLFLAGAFSGWVFARLVHSFGWGGAGTIQLTLCPIIAVVALLLVREKELLQVPKKTASPGLVRT